MSLITFAEDYISRYMLVPDHPAIGDAIDEDGSGFISLYETKDFLSQCPEGWSTPEWLV